MNVFLAAKKRFSAVAFSCAILSSGAMASGIPTVDVAAIAQHLQQYMQMLEDARVQIEQYDTQIEQYKNQLLNSTMPAQEIWNDAVNTMDDLERTLRKYQYYKEQVGDLNAILQTYHDLSYYRESSCFTTGCTEDDYIKIEKDKEAILNQRRQANTDLLVTNEQERKELKKDVDQLRKLQAAAGDAEGQLQALGYANQLSASTNSQLIQIRKSMAAQQQATAIAMQSQADKDAREKAAYDAAIESRYKPSQPREW